MLARDTLQGRARAWAGLMAGLSVVLVGLLCLFILPSLHSGPRDLHVGVVAPSGQEERLADALAAEAPGAYTLVPYGSVDTLDAAIEDRSVVGGLDLTGPGVTVHVASAGSTAVSGHLSASGAALAAGLGTSVAVRDVVPLPDADPTGVGGEGWPSRSSSAASSRRSPSARSCRAGAGGCSPGSSASRRSAASWSPPCSRSCSGASTAAPCSLWRRASPSA